MRAVRTPQQERSDRTRRVLLDATVDSLMAQFENPAADDYRLKSGSFLRSLIQGVTGCDHDEMTRAMAPPLPAPRIPTGLRIVE